MGCGASSPARQPEDARPAHRTDGAEGSAAHPSQECTGLAGVAQQQQVAEGSPGGEGPGDGGNGGDGGDGGSKANGYPDVANAAERDLLEAAMEGNLAVVKAALQEPDINVNVHDFDGATPLHRVCLERYAEYLQVVEALLQAGADVGARDHGGSTPLHLAAEAGSMDVMERLLAAGADPSARARNGETPLHRAIMRSQAEAALFLLGEGADPNAKKEDNHETVLHYAAFWCLMPVVQELLKRDADAEAVNKEGKKPRDYARQNHRMDIAAVLTIYMRDED